MGLHAGFSQSPFKYGNVPFTTGFPPVGAHRNYFRAFGPSIAHYLGISDSRTCLTTWPQEFFLRQIAHMFGSPKRLTTLPQELFFFQKNNPIFLESAG